jgi:nicotinate phosphoribosyltransferase
MKPKEQVKLSFTPLPTGEDSEYGDLNIAIKGLWTETIVYEIPLLALTSEAYFKFCNKDWNHDGQEERACRKCLTLLEHGCFISEFGSRRRRDYKTQDLVMKGLCRASKQAKEKGWKGKLTGTSNVHFAMKYDILPVGTVAHEWYMGIAAVTDNYEDANELALRYWLATFGEGVRLTARLLRKVMSTNRMTGSGYCSDGYFWHAGILRCFQKTNTIDCNYSAWSGSNNSFCGLRHHYRRT